MSVIYLRHPKHGTKVASTDVEARYDRENGWVEYDPEEATEVPALPPFLGGGSDLPTDFPGRKELIGAGHTTWKDVVTLTYEQLVEINGIGDKTANAILEAIEQ